ncbi:hypothetical protein ASPZODRAFT_153551 [Penicilliopsis zonata CBS 506.65]|uniref:L-serine ammonia-lyase n=1 Tax=Penicilliopsis zonata CBS 506.65 TaxID=1073090 RepID=A0A1L9SC27_9EURO|nr:hypothetical protein ASPZODRAFT_153551 [Penicilliopsis zonata CBS 506.65]OJJ44647.1 hypothetical protein ASPZODRAFT_153551 [Penicilliopsis zonata CBS 506.65]
MGSISAYPADTLPALKKPWIETPLVESAALSRLAGCRMFLKLENTQPSGSFKSRAMGNQILSHLANPAYRGRPIHFYASSGGNAGLAAVCAARSLGYPCTVVVPVSTKPLMVEKLRSAGAVDVIRHGETFAEAGKYMKEVVMMNKYRHASTDEEGEEEEAEAVVKIALHPFDKESIWEGNSTIIDELEKQLPPPLGEEERAAYSDRAMAADAIICSVGGGGLLNGLIMGLERITHAQTKSTPKAPTSTSYDSAINILAIETVGTDSLALALAQKSLVSLPKITSQATSLGAVCVSERTFSYALSPPAGIRVHSTVLSDADAARGVLRLADSERTLVELACGVCVEAAIGDSAAAPMSAGRRAPPDEGYGDDRSSSTENEIESDLDAQDPLPAADAVALTSKLRQLVPGLGPQSRVVIIVCGGSNITIEMAAEWRQMLEQGWQ